MTRLLTLLFSICLLLLYAENSSACTCAFGGSAPCQEFWRVDAVFAGTVVGSSKVNVDEGGYKHDMRLVHLTVDQPLRGMQSAEVDVLTGWGGGDCGYGFNLGQRYLVYAYREEKSKRLATSICTRTRLLSEAEDDFAFIKALPASSGQGLIFGIVGKRNHHWKEGDQWYLPVADAELEIEGEGTKYHAQSDAKGNFRVENVLPGKYTVKLKLPPGLIRNSLQKDAGATTVENEVEVAARGCAETGFYLESDTRVRGRVVDAKGNPVANMRLDMRGAAADKKTINTFLSATTDADGYFEFTTVPPGDFLLGYHLLNSALQESQPYARTYYPGVTSKALATVVTVKEGQMLSGLTLQMPAPLSPRTVTGGIVWSDGEPVNGASVYLSLIEEGEMSSFSSVQADAQGHFTLKLLEGLQYKVSAYRQVNGGKSAQSEYIDIPMALEQPLRLVLPTQSRN